MISEDVFLKRIKNLPVLIFSKTKKASYSNFRVEGNFLYFTRVNTRKEWSFNIEKLYQIYSTNNFINTSTIKSNTHGRTNSPSIAVLLSIHCIDEHGYKIN
jgi:hypothetical protein